VKLVLDTVHKYVSGPQTGRFVDVLVKVIGAGAQTLVCDDVNEGVGGPCTQMVLITESYPQILVG
jgi:hypothetical protein